MYTVKDYTKVKCCKELNNCLTQAVIQVAAVKIRKWKENKGFQTGVL
jgi:hypothetical protein